MIQSAISLQASSNGLMANYLSQFEIQSERAANQNLNTALESLNINRNAYTQPELRAMIKLEQLKLIGDLGFAEVLLRGKLIKEIEDEGLWSVHPNRYASMKEAAKDQGISLSEYSNIRNLYNIVFPYLSGKLGLNLAEIWEEVGKSNFRELCPYLVRAITGEPSSSRHVESAYSALREDLEASNSASGITMTEEELRRAGVEQLMEAGHLTNRQLRARIRPERPRSFTVHVVDTIHNGTPKKVLVSLVDDEQYAVIQRRLGGHAHLRAALIGELAQSQFGRMIIDASRT